MAIVDYLILTPLDEEFQAFREAWPVSLAETIVGKTRFYKGLFTRNGLNSLVVASAMGDMGQAWSGVFASEALRTWSPANVIQIGIAGSLVGKKLPLGDVLIPQDVLGYDVGEAIDKKSGTEFTFRPTGRQTDFALMGAARALYNDKDDYSSWRSDAKKINAMEGKPSGSRSPDVHIGSKEVIASGNFVMKSNNFAKQLKQQIHPKLRAVEMEAKGLFDAVRLARDNAGTLIVRGISDQAGPDKEVVDDATGGAYRRASVRAATRFVAALIERELKFGRTWSQALKLNVKAHRNSSLAAREHGLISQGKKSVCVVFDPLLEMTAGGPELILTVRAEIAGDDAYLQMTLRQTRGPWRQLLPNVESSTAEWTVDRSAEPYTLSLAIVTSSPKLELTVSVRSEFGTQDEKSCRFGDTTSST
jgi:nucleoside phosphorylase